MELRDEEDEEQARESERGRQPVVKMDDIEDFDEEAMRRIEKILQHR